MAMRVEGIGIKGNVLREMAEQIVYQSHMVVSINTGKFYPFATEDMVVREVNSKL